MTEAMPDWANEDIPAESYQTDLNPACHTEPVYEPSPKPSYSKRQAQNNNDADYEVAYIRQTEKAIQATIYTQNNQEDQAWIPKSQIRNWKEDYEWAELKPGTGITVTLPEWIAKEKGLI